VRWIVTLSGNPPDVERLAAGFADLSAAEGSPRELRLEFDNPEGETPQEDTANVARAVIEAQVRRINGFARLRWGRTFEGVEISNYMTVGPDGKIAQVVFVGTAYDHMLPEDFADMVEQLGHQRPELPAGLDAINALDGEAVANLAATNPSVALVLRLIDEMLVGDEEIDWGAAYSALEVIEHDLHDRGLDGQDLGWWTGTERDRFRATANSVEVLGSHARHGKPFGLTEARMTSKDASWLIRRVAALWVTWLPQNEAPADLT
jgi:hypothetical protein